MTLEIAADPIPIRVNAAGVALVADTRVPIDTIIYHFKDGETPDDIARQFDALDLADVHAVIGYYLRHRREVDEYLRERERIAAEVRAEAERRFPRPSSASG